jgi:hypothetical protein
MPILKAGGNGRKKKKGGKIVLDIFLYWNVSYGHGTSCYHF